MAVNDIYQIQTIGVAGGEYAVNILHVKLTADSTTSVLAAAAAVVNQFSTTWKTKWLACLAADYTLTGFRARRIAPSGGPSAAFVTPGAVGSVSGVSVSASVGGGIVGPFEEPSFTPPDVVPFWRSAKIFMPSAPEAYIISNQLQTAYIAALGALVSTLETAVSGSSVSWEWGAWSRQYSQFVGITNWTLSDKVYFQRRRSTPVL